MEPAHQLDEAYLAFDPLKPLQGPQLQAFYVDRDRNPFTEMRAILLRAPDVPDKLLFTGHRGSGKSTELNRLTADPEIQRAFLLVSFGLEDLLDPLDLHYLDILIALEAAIYRAGRRAGIDLDPRLARQLTEFWMGEGRKVGFLPSEQEPPLARLDSWFEALIGPFGKLRLEAHTREVLRGALHGRIASLVTHIAWLAATIRERLGRNILVVIDDLDKPDLAIAQDLFYRRATSLTQPPCKLIYTFPIALLYTIEFRTVAHNFAGWFVLPNIKVRTREGALHGPGIGTMQEVVHRRMAPELIEPEALEYLVLMSGGVMRELTTLLRLACNKALVAGKSQITRREAEEAVAELRAVFERALRREHYAQLVQVAQDKRIRDVHYVREPGNAEESELALLELLHNLSILEYRDGEGWWDVHPIVASLL